MSNSLDPDQARHYVGPDLGPNCLHRLSAEDTTRQTVCIGYLQRTLLYISAPLGFILSTFSAIVTKEWNNHIHFDKFHFLTCCHCSFLKVLVNYIWILAAQLYRRAIPQRRGHGYSQFFLIRMLGSSIYCFTSQKISGI